MFFQTPIESITVGEQVLPIVKTRRKKSIGIKSNAQSLELHVPQHLSDRALRKVLDSHIGWITQRVNGFRVSKPSLFEFQIGDKVLFQGEPYTFSIQTPEDLKNIRIECVSEQFRVTAPIKRWMKFESIETQQAWLKSHLQNWFKQQAQDYFAKHLPIYASQIGVTAKAIQVKSYKSRWGSCYPDGRIQFNWRLLQAPTWVIDYVIVHELCHLQHANHSAAFWNLVEKHYPQTQQAKKWLKENQSTLIHFLS